MILCMFIKFIKPLCFILHASRNYLAPISHVSNFHYGFYNQIATPYNLFRVILCMFIKFIKPLCFISHVFRNYLAHISQLSRTYLAQLSRTHLATISHTSRNYLSHLSRTFQTFTLSFTIKLLPLLSYLKWFCACLLSLLKPLCFISYTFHTYLARIWHILEVVLCLLISSSLLQSLVCIYSDFIFFHVFFFNLNLAIETTISISVYL